ncbi:MULTISPECIES: HAMP domain-containing sensor histidine kinase [unclassified Amycolatopsis]|uniref:sensor histidine kinase n=1 Tax=unclassified Amycolatopsis TaxID=2618356 RepID=UPI0028766A8C|nr:MULTISPECIES: HAMP domain-containing sensor histidine kinase [unclassified Amycolatopsis]MDS0133551.1 HAMP domain-containing histidine kinase [Amycolatopsis sp. 505]MDS0146781.1 HAMP domain-containing histidine kinase [Amycolatopsis sp. CM201R]
MARILPRSTRWRVALFAALASAVVLGFGAYWFVNALQSSLEPNASARASDKADALLALLNAGVAPADVPERYPKGGGYMISLQAADCSLGSPKKFSGSEPVRVYGPDCVIVQPFGLDDQLYSTARTKDRHYAVVSAEKLDPVGLETVATARQLLWGGVPAASLFIGAVAWFAVRRSLRAVGAIRAEVDGVRATDLGRRVPVPDSGDEIAELAVTMNEMLARLDRSVQRQSQFTADASHELRTPLASLRTQLEVQLAHPDRLDWRRSVENAVLDVSRMETLTGDLLLLSKLDAGRPAGTTRIVLGDLVTGHLAGRLPRDGVEVRPELHDAPVVQGHAGRLERVLRNLVDNAERHAKSRVTITLAASGGQAVLTVRDDGPGIPAEDRERVFDRFVRLDDDRAREDGGSGLGLAIAAEIARAHGGTLRVAKSTSGACLELRLPLA